MHMESIFIAEATIQKQINAFARTLLPYSYFR